MLPDAVILAAGASSRMGRPKALLELDGVPLVASHRAAYAAHTTRVAVVVGARAADVSRAAGGLVVHNPDWATSHPADSLRLALTQLDIRGPCFVSPVDTPPPLDSTLETLIATGADSVPVSAKGQPGHPVLIGAATVRRIRDAAPDGGLRALLADASRVPVPDPLVHLDFDTPARWRAFLQALAAARSG